MAKRIAIDHIRGHRRRAAILKEASDVLEPEPDIGPEPAILARDEMRVIDAALTELPGKCREMLMLSRVQGMTHGEIAKRMDVSKSLVEKYLTLTMQHCQQRLRESRATEIDGGAAGPALPGDGGRGR